MKRTLIAASVAAALSLPLVSHACTALGYVITVNVHEDFPTSPAVVYVRFPTSTGGVMGATTTNLAVVSAAAAAVTGNQRVQMIANGGGSGTCPAALVGPVVSVDLRP